MIYVFFYLVFLAIMGRIFKVVLEGFENGGVFIEREREAQKNAAASH